MMFDEISRWREGTPPSFSFVPPFLFHRRSIRQFSAQFDWNPYYPPQISFDTMEQHPMSLQSPNGSPGMDSASSNGFPPRHIEGQCVHRCSLSKTTPPQMVFYHQASRCEWHQQRGGPTGPSLYNPSKHGPNAMSFMTPSPAPRQTMANPMISGSERSLSQATFNSSEYSEQDLQNRADSNRSLEIANEDSGYSVSDSVEYVSPIREEVVSESEGDVSGNMVCDDLHTQSNSDSGFDSEKMHDMHLKFTIYSQQGVNPARGPTAFKSRGKPKYFTHVFKGKKYPINVANNDFAILKARLFELSNLMGEKSQGNSFIFHAADSTNSVDIIGYINTHNVYNKGAEELIRTNEDVQNFFQAVLKNPKKISGFDVSMHDPSKKDRQVELDISIGQHKLQAKNLTSNVPTNESDLAHATPEDPVDKAMAALMLKYSTAQNNTSEGWRVYKQDDLTKVMQLNFQQMDVWAKKMVSNPDSVTVDIPPVMDGFQWVDLKNPLTLQTPNTLTKRPTYDPLEKYPIGGIAEAQGYDIEVDPYDLDRVRNHTTMEEYMEFASVRVQARYEACRILMEHDIDSFDFFLYPEVTSLQAIMEMGIKRGTAMRLMHCARRFFQHLLNEEKANSPGHSGSRMVI
ncbi:hypothetical protein DFH28DRAFT_1073243 [Melampsora americana]|nr:hypothetical protein DFH28DRAFT_1073243 [Melampsora americana]